VTFGDAGRTLNVLCGALTGLVGAILRMLAIVILFRGKR
jgi:hypothetical protein